MSHPNAVIRARRAAPVLGALALVLTGCQPMLNMEAARKAISDGLVQQLGLEITSVDCPAEARPMKGGDTFECIATPMDGGTLHVTVKQQDDAGNINWEVAKSVGLFDLDTIQAKIEQGLADQAGVEATVSCGEGRWRVAEVGDTFDCQVTGADGQTSTAVVTVTDETGSISWAMN